MGKGYHWRHTVQFQLKDAYCPSCSKPVTLATIAPDPTHPDIAHLNYECADCGPVMLRVVSMQSNKPVVLGPPHHLAPTESPASRSGFCFEQADSLLDNGSR